MIKKKIMTSYPFLRSINSIQMQKLIPCLKYYVDYIDVVIVIVFILVFLVIFDTAIFIIIIAIAFVRTNKLVMA